MCCLHYNLVTIFEYLHQFSARNGRMANYFTNFAEKLSLKMSFILIINNNPMGPAFLL